MADEQAGQAAGTGADLGALQKQIEELTRRLGEMEQGRAAAVSDAAKARDRLRAMEQTVRQAVGDEGEPDKNQPWEQRIAALGSKFTEQFTAIQQQLDAEKRARAAAELSAVRARIGAEMRLPAALIERLQGETEDALRKDAEALAAALPPQQQSTIVSPANPAGDTGDATSELARRLYNRRKPLAAPAELFSPDGNKLMGGGVRGE